MILNGVACLGMAYSGCSVVSAVAFLALSLACHGATSAGTLSSMVDIAPNFAGITLGIVSSIAIMSGFVSPILVGYITFENQSVGAWQHIFEICAAMLLVCGALYMWLNDTSLQPWNSPAKPTGPKELAMLNESYEDEEEEEEELIVYTKTRAMSVAF